MRLQEPEVKSTLLAGLLLAFALPTHAQVVVLAHPDSGDFVVVQNRPTPRAEALHRASAKGRTGSWKPLLSSTVPGHGAMFCFRPKGGEMRYFIAEGKATGTEAVTDARAQANAAARGTGATTGICGTWNNRNAYPLDALPSSSAPAPTAGRATVNHSGERPRKDGEGGLIETIKRQVRDQVACDPKQEPCRPPPKPVGTGVRG